MTKQSSKTIRENGTDEDILHRIEHAFTRKHASMLTVFTGFLALESVLNIIQIITEWVK